MKTSRRTLEDLDVSRNRIARRWGSGGYGSQFPEEPITNYLDVRKLANKDNYKIISKVIYNFIHFENSYFILFCFKGSILWTNRNRYPRTNI